MPLIELKLYDRRVTEESLPKLIHELTEGLVRGAREAAHARAVRVHDVELGRARAACAVARERDLLPVGRPRGIEVVTRPRNPAQALPVGANDVDVCAACAAVAREGDFAIRWGRGHSGGRQDERECGSAREEELLHSRNCRPIVFKVRLRLAT